MKKLTLASRFKPGFTIVELLIVVSVLAVVATIALATFNTIQRSVANMLVERTAAEAQRTLQTYFIANRYYPANIANTDYKPPLDAPVVLYTNAGQVPKYNDLDDEQNAQLFLNACNGFMPIVLNGVQYNNACVYNGNNMHVKGTVTSNVVLQGPTIEQADFGLTCGPACDSIASTIASKFIEQGGSFPIVVPKNGSPLPEPELITMGNATDYCLEVRSSRYSDIIYHATPRSANDDIGPCNTSGGLHYP